ncbi:MAG: hypothetical protein IKJ45_03640, partial [Kiritimatiellae bacterium]|nr:hypothetical protein [Kiritimatiellia bacterium]
LDDVVDRFVIAEATRTHSGKPKELLFEKNKARYAKFLDKIEYVVVDDLLPEEEVAKDSFHLPWVNENRQRNALIRGLAAAKDDDIVMVSDLDEIPRPEKVSEAGKLAASGEIVRLELDIFEYYLNFRDYRNPCWKLGTVVLSWGAFKQDRRIEEVGYDRFTVRGECAGRVIQKIRFLNPSKSIRRGGWHFTYMGGINAIRTKLRAFAHQEAGIAMNEVERRLARGENVLNGRRDSFAIPIDKTFPRYLLENQRRFSRLLIPLPQGGQSLAVGFWKCMAMVRGCVYRMVVRLVPRWLAPRLSSLRQKLFFR